MRLPFLVEAVIRKMSAEKVDVEIRTKVRAPLRSGAQIMVAQAFLKEKKMDGLVRQLSELGIVKWIPFIAERSVPRPEKKQLLTRMKRWEKIAKEALKQCRRGRIMEIGETVSFEEMLNLGQFCDLKVAFWEDELQPFHANLPGPNKQINSVFAIIGPEGGFTQNEIKKAKDQGFVTFCLVPRILRAETATVAACVLLQYLFGDMNQKGLDKKTSL